MSKLNELEQLQYQLSAAIAHGADLKRENDSMQSELAALSQQQDQYVTALAECRDAAGPWHDHPEAMGDPLEVPAKVKDAFDSLRQQIAEAKPAYTFHLDETGAAYLRGACVSKEGDPLYTTPQPCPKCAKAKPVAYGVFWRVDGEDVLQFPVATSVQEAESDISMYAPGDRDAMVVRALYTTPQPCQKCAKAVEALRLAKEHMPRDKWDALFFDGCIAELERN